MTWLDLVLVPTTPAVGVSVVPPFDSQTLDPQPRLTLSPHDLFQPIPRHQQLVDAFIVIRSERLGVIILVNNPAVNLGQALDLDPRNRALEVLEPLIIPALARARVDVDAHAPFLGVRRD